MQAGRDLDALIAEMMGWTWDEKTAHSPTGSRNDNRGKYEWWWLPKYSSDMAAAWEVVEHVRKYSGRNAFSLFGPSDESEAWFCGFERKWHGRQFENIYDLEAGDTAAHAICLAAIKAIKEATASTPRI